jgi:t-SNARE complex subunit (syntaxin)
MDLLVINGKVLIGSWSLFFGFHLENRVRENMNTTLTKKFVDEMKIYQQAQQQYKNDIKMKVKRQVQVVKPDATDEDVDQVMKSEGGKDALLRQSILAGGVNDQIK